jgi:hypothetical protein
MLALTLATMAQAAGPPTVVFLSDFGTRDDAVAVCKGVMLQVAPNVRVIDLTHEVTPFAIGEAARLLADTAEHYPPNTVFLAIVDPGVGSERKPMVADRQALAGTREITNARWMRAGGRSSTFHGRDVFAPVAAHLARGDDWTRAGPAIERPVRLDVRPPAMDGDRLRGTVVATDGPYGNLITDVDAALFASLGWAIGDRVPVEIGTERLTLPFVRTFSDVPLKAPLLYVDSRARIGIALNQGNFAQAHRVAIPSPLVVPRK